MASLDRTNIMMSVSELLKRNLEFFKESFTNCIETSELSTVRVGASLDHLMEDSVRITSLSKEALKSIDLLKEQLENSLDSGKLLSKDTTGEMKKGHAGYLVKALEQLSSKDQTIQELINPIVMALQYQDRLQQHFNNLLKFMVTLEQTAGELNEEAIIEVYDPQNENFEPLGNKMYDITTMEEEREILRNYFAEIKDRVDVQPEDDDDGGISFFL